MKIFLQKHLKIATIVLLFAMCTPYFCSFYFWWRCHVAQKRLCEYAMANSVKIVGVLSTIDIDGVISKESKEVLENMAYVSVLFSINADSEMTTQPWAAFLVELKKYIQQHPREENTPVIESLQEELAKRINE